MNSLKGVTLAIISSATFGMIALFSIPLMQQEMNIQSILIYRFLFSALLMGGVCLIRKESLKISLRQLLPLALLGVMYASTSLFLIYSYQWVPSGVATTIHFLYPVLVSIIMVLFFKEKGSPLLFFTAIASLIGVMLLCWSDNGSIQTQGLITSSLTILTYALYIVGINQTKVGKEMRAEPLAFYVLFFSALLFIGFGLVTAEIQQIQDIPSLGRLFALAMLPTVISDLALILAIKYIGSTVTSILGSMEPLVAMLIGVLYFSEVFTGYTLAGILLILTAVCLVIRQSAKIKKADELSRK